MKTILCTVMLCTVAIGFGAFYFSSPGLAQTLEQELSLLIADDPVIAAAQKDVEAAENDIDVAFSQFLPAVTVSGDAGYEYTDRPNADSSENPTNTDRERATLTVTETLFDGFQREGNLDASEFSRAIADESLSATTRDQLLEGIRAYLDVLRQTRLTKLARENEVRIQAQLKLEDERVRRGAGISVDVLFAKARLQIAKERRVAFDGRLRDAFARYLQLFNRAAKFDTMVEPVPPVDLLPEDAETAVDLALKENPDVRVAQRQVDVADERRTIARSDYFPKFDLVGRANWERDVDGIEGNRTDFSVLLQLSWNIFSGFETNARVAKASAEYHGQRRRLTNTQRLSIEEAQLAFNEFMTSRERVELLQNAVDIAAEVFQARKRLRQAGKETTINVLDSETELNTALINFTVASYDARIAVYRVLAAVGRLTPRNLRLAVPNP